MELAIFYMMFVLKIPVIFMIWLVFWSSRQYDQNNPPLDDGPGGSKNKDPDPIKPLSPDCRGRRWRPWTTRANVERKRGSSPRERSKVF